MLCEMQKKLKKKKTTTETEYLGQVDLYKEDLKKTYEFRDEVYSCFPLELEKFPDLANL